MGISKFNVPIYEFFLNEWEVRTECLKNKTKGTLKCVPSVHYVPSVLRTKRSVQRNVPSVIVS
jgi:hypothetical protein